MNAIGMLKRQHREVEKLFEQIGEAEDGEKQHLFEQLADALAIHATIEERHFYQAVKTDQTEELLRESLEEHLAVKRLIADLLELEAGDETFDAKIDVLEEQVSHHVEEEEQQLFPLVQKLLDDDQLEAIAQEMIATASDLEGREPRRMVLEETGAAAPLD